MKILITSLYSAYEQRKNHISQYHLAFDDIVFTACKCRKNCGGEFIFIIYHKCPIQRVVETCKL